MFFYDKARKVKDKKKKKKKKKKRKKRKSGMQIKHIIQLLAL